MTTLWVGECSCGEVFWGEGSPVSDEALVHWDETSPLETMRFVFGEKGISE